MRPTVPALALLLAFGAARAHAQEPPPPSEERSLLWVPAALGLVGGFVFLGGALNAASDDRFGEQRSLALACLADPASSVCAQLDGIGRAYASAGTDRPVDSICDPSVAAEYGITQDCDAREGLQRRYRLHVSLSAVSFALSLVTFVGYLVEERRRERADGVALRVQPWLDARPRTGSGGLRLHLTF